MSQRRGSPSGPGRDRVIIVTYVDVDEAEVPSHRPTVVVVDEENRMADTA